MTLAFYSVNLFSVFLFLVLAKNNAKLLPIAGYAAADFGILLPFTAFFSPDFAASSQVPF